MTGVAASAVRIGAVRRQFLEVMPGREGVSTRRDHHRADALVRSEAFELVRQGLQHRLGQAVAGLRAVERENGNVADILPQHDRLVRGCGVAGTDGGLRFHRRAFPGRGFPGTTALLSAAGGRRKSPEHGLRRRVKAQG